MRLADGVGRGQDAEQPVRSTRDVVFQARNVSVYYGEKLAVDAVSLDIYRNYATALIGPSGCGKSTFLRCLNRMNDSIPGFRISGELLYHGHDLYDARANRVEVRRRIGMVFQKPNPFPKSIYDNIAWAARNLGMRENLDERVERALRGAALWDEVKDRLKSSALGLSGGQQQRLCIARAIAIEPDVLLLDEPRLGARSDRDRVDRGPGPRAEDALLDRDRHAQHAAGRAGRRQDRVLQPRRAARRHADRVRRHLQAVLEPGRPPHPRLHQRPFRLIVSGRFALIAIVGAPQVPT